MRQRFALAIAAVVGCLFGTTHAQAASQGWGNIKGQVVFAGDYKPVPIKVDKDQAHCLSRGPLMDEKYVVNPKNKGVRWVMVWLTDPKNPTKKLPIHPSYPKNVAG